jgi:hypothetical protein
MNHSKSLKELYKKKLNRPNFDSYLAQECHRLWSVPISALSIEDLRLLIGQQIGLRYVVPMALEILSSDPLAQGDMYKGDLLASIAAIPEGFWTENPLLNNQVVELKNDLVTILQTVKDELLPSLSKHKYL